MADDRLEKVNTLARIYYLSRGYRVEPGYRFDKARHPEEKGMFGLAYLAYSYLVDEEDVETILESLE